MSVLVLHDEQNLWDPETSSDGATWEVDSAVAALGAQLEVIGVPHAGSRRAYEYVGDGLDAHVARLLAIVADAAQPVGVGGSSFGAYASLYAWARHPSVFTRVLAMSPALWVRRERIFEAVGRVDGRGARVWIDVGGDEHPDPAYLDEYLRGYEEMRALLVERGCEVGGYLDQGAIHHETAWAHRLPGALRFLYA
jgi:predicted alpha/beta superfamily hydrolase